MTEINIDREKVINGLKTCIESDSCKKCQYNEYALDCSWHLMYEAFMLLKAEKPRVLTLEEVRPLPTAPPVAVVVEERVPIDSWDEGSVCKWVGSMFVREEYLGDNVCFHAGTYRKIWRVWTAWPSDEQIEEVAWE